MDADAGPSPPFFPDALDGFRARWFARYLVAFDEAPLWPPGKYGETYRFTWLRSFHAPIMVRLDIREGRAWLVGKRNSGAGGYSTGSRLEETRREIPMTEARHVADRLELKNDTEMVNAKDGAEWILEAVRDGLYSLRVVWSPSNGAFRDGCLALVSASGLQVTGRVY